MGCMEQAETAGIGGEPPGLLNTAASAGWLGLGENTLRKMRMAGVGPAYVRIGRAVRYRLADLAAYADARRVGGEA